MLLAFLALASIGTISAQAGGPSHRIVFQVASADTLEHKMLMRQLNNALATAPDASIEVVCHGPGLDMILGDRTIVHKAISALKERGIQFLACENSLKERKIARDLVIAEAGSVPAAIIHIVERQVEGWSYIKAGF